MIDFHTDSIRRAGRNSTPKPVNRCECVCLLLFQMPSFIPSLLSMTSLSSCIVSSKKFIGILGLKMYVEPVANGNCPHPCYLHGGGSRDSLSDDKN